MILFSIFKKITDFTVALIGIILFSPFILIYSIWIILFYKTNPIIKQSRGISLSNGIITIFKLRTMKPDSKVFYKDELSLSKTTTEDRILPGGRFLRKTGFDETPQFLNVLCGKMSLIGPRPLVFDDLLRMQKINKDYLGLRSKLKSKPGISGLWQLKRSKELNFEELITFDSEYETERNINFEMKLILMTMKRLVTKKHTDGISR
jgi:lipopolysaccharide/colanic/teichoic acid biosynthesis glycosyltransferase